MPSTSLEDRLSAVEAELERLKERLDSSPDREVPWWETIFGTFRDNEEYEQAMRLGREYRESLRPKGRSDGR